jgi:hypothetical protein
MVEALKILHDCCEFETHAVIRTLLETSVVVILHFEAVEVKRGSLALRQDLLVMDVLDTSSNIFRAIWNWSAQILVLVRQQAESIQ